MTQRKQNIFKGYRLKSEIVSKLEQLTEYENSLSQNQMLPDFSEREILEKAIEYYHSAIFGDEILDLRIERIGDITANKMDLILRPFVETLASISNTQLLKMNALLDLWALQFQLRSFNFHELDEPNDVEDRIEEGRKLTKYIEDLIIEKHNL